MMIHARLHLLMLVTSIATVPCVATGQARWRLVEELRIGGEESGPSSFAEIRDIAVGKQGQIYVLDREDEGIRIFDGDGRFVRVFGREGAGPGEWGETNGFELAPDGTVWINDHLHGRMVVFTADGDRLREVPATPIGFGWKWLAGFTPTGDLVEFVNWSGSDDEVPRLAFRQFGNSTREWTTFSAASCPLRSETDTPLNWSYRTANGGGSIGIPFAPRAVLLLDPIRLEWICARGSDFRVFGWGARRGVATWEFAGNVARVPIPRSAKDSAVRAIEQRFAQLQRFIPRGTIRREDIPANYPALDAVELDDKGRLWIFRPTASGRLIEVRDRTGSVIATLDAPPSQYAGFVTVIRGSQFYTVLLDEFDIPSVVRYRIAE